MITRMRVSLATAVVAGALLVAVSAAAADDGLAPLPSAIAQSTHGPFEAGACDTCHQRNDPDDPGAVAKASNDLCYDCHDEFASGRPVRMDAAVHPTSKASCLTCHSPHNARNRKLLL